MAYNLSANFDHKVYVSYDELINSSRCLMNCGTTFNDISEDEIMHHYRQYHQNFVATQCHNCPKEMDSKMFLQCCIHSATQMTFPVMLTPEDLARVSSLSPHAMNFLMAASGKQLRRKITNLLQNKMFTVKLDIITFQDFGTLLGIHLFHVENAQNWPLTIGIPLVRSDCTRQSAIDTAMEVLNQFGVSVPQIYAFTFDHKIRYANFDIETKCCEQHEDQDLVVSFTHMLPNPVHVLQQAARSVIERLKVDIDYYRYELLEMREPYLDRDIDWFTTYHMLCAVPDMEFRGSLDFALKFTEAFDVVYRFEYNLRHHQKLYTFGDFYDDWLYCESVLMGMSQLNSVADILLAAMLEQRTKLLKVNAVLAALYLDPRFNYVESEVLTEDEKEKAIEHLMLTYKQIYNLPCSSERLATSTPTPTQTFSNDSGISSTNCSSSAVASAKSEMSDRAAEEVPEFIAHWKINKYIVKQRLKSLAERQSVPQAFNILEYWHRCYQFDAAMLELGNVVLAIPTLDNTASRALCAYPHFVRNYTFKEDLSHVILTKYNLHLLDMDELLMAVLRTFIGEHKHSCV